MEGNTGKNFMLSQYSGRKLPSLLYHILDVFVLMMCLNEEEDLDSPNFSALLRRLLELLRWAEHKRVDLKDVAMPLAMNLNQSPAQWKEEYIVGIGFLV